MYKIGVTTKHVQNQFAKGESSDVILYSKLCSLQVFLVLHLWSSRIKVLRVPQPSLKQLEKKSWICCWNVSLNFEINLESTESTEIKLHFFLDFGIFSNMQQPALNLSEVMDWSLSEEHRSGFDAVPLIFDSLYPKVLTQGEPENSGFIWIYE